MTFSNGTTKFSYVVGAGLQFMIGDGEDYSEGECEGCGGGFGPKHTDLLGHGFLCLPWDNPLISRGYLWAYPRYLVMKNRTDADPLVDVQAYRNE